MNNKILELNDINKIYRTKAEEKNILKNINFVFEKGDFITIQGKSGSGKTTLLNIIGLLDEASNGVMEIEEKQINYKNERVKNKIRHEKIGFVFQFHYLLNEFTALENVMIPALINKKINKKELKEKARQLLELVELGHRINHKPLELSGGEKQRVAIARALINDPEILLADEPTGNLDSDTSDIINGLFKKINEEKEQAIIIVTHSIELANMAKKQYVIKNGEFKLL